MKTAKATINLDEFRVSGKYDHRVSAITRGFMALPEEDQLAYINAFIKAPKGDHFYSVQLGDRKVFICENGEGYTAMLPGEY